VSVWREPDEPVHPLLGIVTALERASGRAVLACACDLPFVTPELVRSLAASVASIALPRVGGRLHPLLARYERSHLPALRESLARGAPVQETVLALDPLVIGEDELRAFGDPERLLFNVNTSTDLERAERMFGSSV
jgi:molybdopterin-guanine dinucleotide biosynthesis protein A